MSAALAVAACTAEIPTAALSDEPASELVAVDAGPPTLAVPAQPAPADEPIGPVLASWYGPGMWGNRTACGATLTDDLIGVAHRSLPCGWTVVLRRGSAIVALPVVDRGPYVNNREFDLTYAAKLALGCPDLCRLDWMR